MSFFQKRPQRVSDWPPKSIFTREIGIMHRLVLLLLEIDFEVTECVASGFFYFEEAHDRWFTEHKSEIYREETDMRKKTSVDFVSTEIILF